MEKDGGPAFPCAHEGGQKGLTLRDYFAAQALVVNGPVFAAQVAQGGDPEHVRLDALVTHCYQIADAMLWARAQ